MLICSKGAPGPGVSAKEFFSDLFVSLLSFSAGHRHRHLQVTKVKTGRFTWSSAFVPAFVQTVGADVLLKSEIYALRWVNVFYFASLFWFAGYSGDNSQFWNGDILGLRKITVLLQDFFIVLISFKK